MAGNGITVYVPYKLYRFFTAEARGKLPGKIHSFYRIFLMNMLKAQRHYMGKGKDRKRDEKMEFMNEKYGMDGEICCKENGRSRHFSAAPRGYIWGPISCSQACWAAW